MTGKVVVVTGASAGVGRATARELARRGASVALLARGEEGLDGACADVERLGAAALPLAVDVADADAVERAADEVEERLGPIDVWVNNATATVFSRFLDVTAEEFERATAVSYLGFVNGTRAALSRMVPPDRGTIVQVGSALAYRGIPLQSAYCGAKHAIQGFTEAVRCELMHDGSRVHLTSVHLPALNTPQFEWSRAKLGKQPQPVPPIFQPEVAARAIAWAAEHRRRELYVGFPTLLSIVGNKLLPGFGDWYLARTGFDSQHTGETIEPVREGNLFEPVAGDQGAHGRFDGRSKERSPHLWLTLHRRAIAAGAGVALGAAAAVARRNGD
jgi:NAD(P)-dependent dehydrogenase (short-subunit alcohol dehydrogenase family)